MFFRLSYFTIKLVETIGKRKLVEVHPARVIIPPPPHSSSSNERTATRSEYILCCFLFSKIEPLLDLLKISFFDTRPLPAP
jgi:hypothetical protein